MLNPIETLIVLNMRFSIGLSMSVEKNNPFNFENVALLWIPMSFTKVESVLKIYLMENPKRYALFLNKFIFWLIRHLIFIWIFEVFFQRCFYFLKNDNSIIYRILGWQDFRNHTNYKLPKTCSAAFLRLYQITILTWKESVYSISAFRSKFEWTSLKTLKPRTVL